MHWYQKLFQPANALAKLVLIYKLTTIELVHNM